MNSSTSSSEPLRSLFRVLLFSCMPVGVLLCALQWGPHASRVDFMGGVALKHARLEALPSPKVIIIGGSNATFGIDSERLEKALCLPVVNMSIHANLGPRFMVEEVKDHLGTGDVVIVALEHSGYSAPAKENDIHILTVDRYPPALDLMPWYQRPKLIAGLAVMRLQGAWKEWIGLWKGNSPDPVYRASGFNAQGDMTAHLDKPARGPSQQQVTNFHPPLFSPDLLPTMAPLEKRLHEVGGTLIFTWPSIARSSFRADYHQAIQEGLRRGGHEILGRTEDYVYPDSAFYDTHYHLHASGRQARTSQLIHDLCGSGRLECCSSGAAGP